MVILLISTGGMHLLESWRYDVEIADDARGEPQTSHKALVERQR
jgi:hypothetical protein